MPYPMERWPTGRLVSTLARRVERDWDAHLARWGLTHAGLPVLDMLTRGPRSQRELADAMGVTEQTMSRVVTGLERRGYVSRRVHPEDRRRHEIVVTPLGTRVAREAGDLAVAEAISVRSLDPDQAARLRELLIAALRADGDLAGDGADDAAAPDDDARPATVGRPDAG